MAPRSRQAEAPLLLLLLAQLSVAVAFFSGYSHYSFPVFDSKATTRHSRLSVYAHDTAAGDPPVNDTAALLLDAPLDLADRLPAQAALVGFFASTVRDLVVGVHDWELTVDSLADVDVGDGPRHKQGEHSKSSPSSWLVILLAVLGSVAAVAAVVVSVLVYLVVARRRAVDMEVQQCYRDYFARMTQ